MSYILDALRKSDAQRRLGQPPDLNTPGPTPTAGSFRRRRLWFTAIIAAVFVFSIAAIVLEDQWRPTIGQWLAGSEPEAPADPAADPEPPPPPAVEPGEAELAEAATAVEAAADQESTDEGLPDEVQPPFTRISRPTPGRTVDRPPAARDPEPERAPRPTTPPRERERLVEDAAEAQRIIDESRAAETPPEVAEAIPQPPPEDAEATRQQPSEEIEEPWTPERSEYLRSWELPLAVRRELPDLRISIHVFSPQAQDRFVLINGERRIEGDDLGGGASLVEIRREGVLVRFRDYSFLLEP